MALHKIFILLNALKLLNKSTRRKKYYLCNIVKLLSKMFPDVVALNKCFIFIFKRFCKIFLNKYIAKLAFSGLGFWSIWVSWDLCPKPSILTPPLFWGGEPQYEQFGLICSLTQNLGTLGRGGQYKFPE